MQIMSYPVYVISLRGAFGVGGCRKVKRAARLESGIPGHA